MAYSGTVTPEAVQGRRQKWAKHSLAYDLGGDTSGSTDVTNLHGVFWGVWWRPTTGTAGGDITVTYGGVDLLSGAGANVGATDQWLPANVSISGVPYAMPIPVDGDVTISLAQMGGTDAGTVELWVELG